MGFFAVQPPLYMIDAYFSGVCLSWVVLWDLNFASQFLLKRNNRKLYELMV